MLQIGDTVFDTATGANVQVLERIDVWGFVSYRVFDPSTGKVYKAAEEQLSQSGGDGTYDENYLRSSPKLKMKRQAAFCPRLQVALFRSRISFMF